jgi:hypothetical protein
MAHYINTDERVKHEDVARYLMQCGQSRMAAAVRQWDAEYLDLGRRYYSMLAELTRLRHEVEPKAPASERVSYKSEWD